MKHTKQYTIFDRHQLSIACRTLHLSDEGAMILGGMTKAEAREVIKRITGKEAKEG